MMMLFEGLFDGTVGHALLVGIGAVAAFDCGDVVAGWLAEDSRHKTQNPKVGPHKPKPRRQSQTDQQRESVRSLPLRAVGRTQQATQWRVFPSL